MNDGIHAMSERSIFLAALDIADPAQRAAYLNGACGNDAAQRKHIEELIAAEAKLGGFLAHPHAAVDVTADVTPMTERPGTIIGPYKLIQQIGEGGMGVVYMAQQTEPVKRLVALKIIKPGMDSRQVIARFEAERQALALMDHPNIAKVLDAGTTNSGRPYFVMELVKGIPITAYCDEKRLTTKQRLELFVPVCHAVQHAHQKGIIHRDLKPSNVMIALYDGRPVPKVIDFGVAKAAGGQLTEKTLVTSFGSLVGTLEYMSPEQAELNQLDVDTRSDIYALGVLLYELLTGDTPFDRKRLRSAAFDEMLRIIREEEPPLPSTRLGTSGSLPAVAASRQIAPAKLAGIIRGEIDWIVMKAMEKDRSRRYETANGLARDIQRYLDDESVEACPPSIGYRMSKLARRYKAALAIAAGFAALLIVGAGISTWQAMRATTAGRAAVASEQKALRAAAAERGAKEAETTERERAEANAKAARDSEHIAQQQRDAATQAQQSAIQEKNNALATREELRHTLYAAEMNLVQAAWESKQYRGVAQLLDQQHPAAGQSDLRGFEWHYWDRRLRHSRLRSVDVPQLVSKNYFRSRTLNISRGGARLAAVLDYPGDSSRMQGFGLVAVFGATGRELFAPLDPFPGWLDVASSDRLLSMSNDGSRLAVAVAAGRSRVESTDSQLDRISIRDGSTGHEIRSLASPGLISQIALTSNGSRLAVVYGERATPTVQQSGVKVWDTSTGELVQTLPMLPGVANSTLLSPDGTRLLRQSYWIETIDNRPSNRQLLLQVVDVASGEELWRREYSNQTAPPRPWAWSPDGKLLVVAEARGIAAKPNVQLWDSDTGTPLAILDRESESMILDATIDFSPDGQLLAVVSAANEIYVWEVPQLPLAAGASHLRIAAPNLTLKTAGEEVRGLSFGADSKSLYSVAGTSIVSWDATVREGTTFGPEPSAGLFSSSGPRSVAFSPDTTKVAFSGNYLHQEFSIWDLTRDEEICRLKTGGVSRGFAPIFSPDGRRIAVVRNSIATTSQAEPQIVIYDAQTGEALHAIRLDKPDASSFVYFGTPLFRPDGKKIAALVFPRTRGVENRGPPGLMAWDAATQKLVFSVTLSDRIFGYLLGYSPDGASLVVGHYDLLTKRGEGVAFYDAATGDRQRSISMPSALRPHWIDFPGQTIGTFGPPDVVSGVQANSYGRSDIVLFDLATGQERLRLRGHDGFDQFAVSPDGSRLALGKQSRSTRDDSEVTLWSLKSGRRLLSLKRPGPVEALAFSPDGNRLLAAFPQFSDSADKPIQIWDATPLPEEIVK
jgi:serine/threonine protein kinase/WD40 repeat protein